MSGPGKFGAKLATLGVGLTIKKSLDYGFDYLLYPLALWWFGYYLGGAIMTAASVVLNLGDCILDKRRLMA